MSNREKFYRREPFTVNGQSFTWMANGPLRNETTGQTFKGYVQTYTDAIGIENWMRSEPNRMEFSEDGELA